MAVRGGLSVGEALALDSGGLAASPLKKRTVRKRFKMFLNHNVELSFILPQNWQILNEMPSL